MSPIPNADLSPETRARIEHMIAKESHVCKLCKAASADHKVVLDVKTGKCVYICTSCYDVIGADYAERHELRDEEAALDFAREHLAEGRINEGND